MVRSISKLKNVKSNHCSNLISHGGMSLRAELIFMNKVFILLFCFLCENIYAEEDYLNNSSSTCAYSRDGSSVSCGGQSMNCAYSRDGSDVSCGGQTSTCAYSRDGSDVSCGGLDE
tara:strand:- start:112 stop:459 length:348 start_codon:yes stop_codon:yes gene_type:complete